MADRSAISTEGEQFAKENGLIFVKASENSSKCGGGVKLTSFLLVYFYYKFHRIVILCHHNHDQMKRCFDFGALIKSLLNESFT